MTENTEDILLLLQASSEQYALGKHCSAEELKEHLREKCNLQELDVGYDLLTVLGTFCTKDCVSSEDLCKLLKTEEGK